MKNQCYTCVHTVGCFHPTLLFIRHYLIAKKTLTKNILNKIWWFQANTSLLAHQIIQKQSFRKL
jgi:hypothetical protein